MTPTSGRAARRRAGLGGVLALGGALAVLGATGPAAAAERPVLIRGCPYTIDRPGLYVLAGDLTCPGPAPAITITADDVRLNLGGNTLTGDERGDGVRAEGTSENPITGLRIANGTVTGFDDGIELDFAPGARVAGVTATGNDDDGVDIGDSPAARVAGVTARDNDIEGIAVDDSPGARIVGNTVERNGISGIDVGNCDRCVIAGNRIADNGGRGLFFSGAGARIEGNTIAGNGSAGIDMEDSGTSGNLVRGNRVTGNDDNGIEVSGGDGNRFEGNTATGNGADGSGFDLVDLNLDEGFFFPDPPPGCVNTWRGNRFATDNEEGAAFGPGAGCIR